MELDTSTASSYWLLVDALPPETDWPALRTELERRLQLGSQAAPTLTDPENQLLVALRSREVLLTSPLYAVREKDDPKWWVYATEGVGALRAAYPG